MRRLIAVSFVATFMLAGCTVSDTSSSESEQPVEEQSVQEETLSPEAQFAIDTVQERYESDCLLPLGEAPVYKYEEDAGGTLREGFVYVTVGGNVLQFSVGTNSETGAFLTVPHNEVTLDLLATAGC